MTGNVAELPSIAAHDFGDRAAVIAGDGGTVTWAQLEQRVAGVAGALREAGLGRGDRVALVLTNTVAFPVAMWGVLRAGGTVVPVNPGYTPPERDHILSDSGAVMALVDGGPVGRPWPVDVTVVDVAALDGPTVASAQTGGGDCAAICYTSGTTGRPKGARLTHENLLANLDAFEGLPLLAVRPDDVVLGVLPFFHVFGLNVVLNGAARHGCAVLALDRFSPRSAAAAMIAQGVTIAYGPPPVYAALSALPESVAFPALRAAVSGADALPVPLWHRFADRHGVQILESYGLTETAPGLSSAAAGTTIVPGSVGPALPGVELRVVDAAGEPVATGQVGEIHARGPNIFEGYHRQPEATRDVLRDGWFATGDLGSFDDAAYLTISGRLKDLIIVSGFNVYPREVEEALRSHPAVAEAAVVGVPDDRTGERVRAVVVPHAEVTAEDLVDHCRQQLARYKLPRDIELVDQLPRLPTGKVLRSALRDPARSRGTGR